MEISNSFTTAIQMHAFSGPDTKHISYVHLCDDSKNKGLSQDARLNEWTITF
jgi:hypothetical protein